VTRPRRRRWPRHACPLCAGPRFNQGLPSTIPLGIPTYWSAETALAVFELVDQIRDIVLAVYGTEIQDAYRQECQATLAEKPVIPDDELPF
jgi:hypothetical protein